LKGAGGGTAATGLAFALGAVGDEEGTTSENKNRQQDAAHRDLLPREGGIRCR
jgi:hypothetical protein